MFNFLDFGQIKKNISKTTFDLVSFQHIRLYLIISISLNVLTWLFANYIYLNSSQDLIFLHYNVDFGVDLIGEVKRVFVIPGLGLIVLLFNFFIVAACHKFKDFKFISHLLLATITMVHVLLLVALASVYLINFR